MRKAIKHNLLMRSIKILDIGYITVIYIFVSLLCARITDKILGKFDPEKEKNKSKLRLTIDIIVAMWSYGVLIYIVRNLVEQIPFPLDGYDGFEHKRVKELGSASVFTFTFMLFCQYIKDLLSYYYSNVIIFPELTKIHTS